MVALNPPLHCPPLLCRPFCAPPTAPCSVLPPFTPAALQALGAVQQGQGQRGQLGPEKAMAEEGPQGAGGLVGQLATVPGSPAVQWLVREPVAG